MIPIRQPIGDRRPEVHTDAPCHPRVLAISSQMAVFRASTKTKKDGREAHP
jgi:hypothetical protein